MAKVRSTSSPVGWPKASLIRLNQSRSISATEQGEPVVYARDYHRGDAFSFNFSRR